jgi:two-component system, NarL family, response regulator DesR
MTISDSVTCRTANPTKVLVADSHHLFRAGLSALLSREQDIEIVGEAATGYEAVAWAVRARADVVVIDARLPASDGFRAAADLRRVAPSIGSLLLTSAECRLDVERAVDVGVNGVLRKNVPPPMFMAAVRDIGGGRRIYDPGLVAGAFREPVMALSDRERETLRLIASGMSNKEIAQVQALSLGTVRNNISAMLTKCQARNRVDAVRIGRDRGWLN